MDARGIKNAYVLKHFQGEGEPLMFIKNIFESDAGEKVYIPQGNTQTAAKLMHQSNLKGELFKLFFENRGTNWAALRNKKITFTGAEAIDFILLKKRLLELMPAVRFYV